MERRLSEIDMQLGAPDLPAARKARLEETRAYYKWLAGLPEAERDKRFRERFDRIDANHDGVIDAGERAAWREQQRAYYGGAGRGGSRQPASAPQQPDGKAAGRETAGREKGRGRAARPRQVGSPPFAVFCCRRSRRRRDHAILRAFAAGNAGFADMTRFKEWTPEGVIPAVLLPRR